MMYDDHDFSDKPTLAEMQDWRDQLRGEWSTSEGGEEDLLTQMQKEEDLYYQQFPVEAPYGKFTVKTGSAPSDLDAAVDSLAPPANVQVKVKPLRSREKYKKQAQKLRYAAAGFLAAWRKRRDELRILTVDQALRRLAIARVMFDESLWPNYPADIANKPTDVSEEDLEEWDDRRIAWEARNRRQCPIILERRDPRYTYFREYHGKIIVVVEHYTTSPLDAYAAFAGYPKARHILRGMHATNTSVTVDEVWYDQWRCIMLNDQPIFDTDEQEDGYVGGVYEGVQEHGYPEIPYAYAAFREVPIENPGKRFRGMLTNGRHLYPIESNVLSMHVFMLAHNAWRTFVGYTVDGRDMEIIPGRYISIDQRKGEYLNVLEGRPVPPELTGTAELVDQYIQRNGVAQGPRSAESTRSAQQLWAIQNNRQLKLESPRGSLQRLVERCLELAFQITETLMSEPLTLPVPGYDREGNALDEVTIRPEDINGYWDAAKVTFIRRLDPAMLEQAKIIQALVAAEFMPEEVGWELSGFTDSPEEWKDLIMDQKTEKLPFVMEVLGLQRLEETLGRDHPMYQLVLQKIIEGKAMQEAGGGPGQMATPAAPSGPVAEPGGQPGSSSTSPEAKNGSAGGRTRGYGMTGGGGKPSNPAP